MAGLGKRLLSSAAARAVVGLSTRLVRRLYLGSVRYRHDPALSAFLDGTEPAVFACWHQDFFFTVGYLSRWARRRPMRVLASASRDGGLMAAAAEAAGFRGAVRGSSARGGAAALRELRRIAAEGHESLVIVCDGPRPPAFTFQSGALAVASSSGLPLWLVRSSYRPAKVLERSWARFFLPSPLGTGIVRADGPIRLPTEMSRAELELARQDLQRRLAALALRADREAAGA